MLGIAALVSVSTLLSTGIVPTKLAGDAVNCLRPPVSGRVVAPYVEPACPYCPGHRTIDFASTLGEAVLSPVAGNVTFYGFVGGRLYITIDPHDSARFAPGVVVTLGGLLLDDVSAEGPNPRRGDPVRQGERVGDAGGWPITLSVRRVGTGENGGPESNGPEKYRVGQYLDPDPMLGRWRVSARLVPRSGRWRSSPPRLVCPAAPNSR
jgi:hypothetical protein